MAEKDFVVKNGLVVNTNLIVADGDLNRVGINNSAPDASLTVTGTANVSGNAVFGANLTAVGNLRSAQLLIGDNVAITNTNLFVGNSTVNSVQTSSLLSVSNSTSVANLSALDYMDRHIQNEVAIPRKRKTKEELLEYKRRYAKKYYAIEKNKEARKQYAKEYHKKKKTNLVD